MSDSDKLIVNAALTGMVATKQHNPSLPVAPEEIAADAARCVDEGASIVHVHARDDGGAPTYLLDRYHEIVAAVRDACPDVVVCVSTSGRVFKSFEERAEVLDLDGDLKPELASLTLGSLNFTREASINDPAMIRALAERMAQRGIVPELEVFDLGMLDYAKHLLERGVLLEPLYFNLLLGSLGTLAATPFNLATLAMSVPAGATWSAAGIARAQFRTNALAVTMGGHVRVGLEDNLYMDDAKQRLATNADLVARVVALSRAFEREPASPDEARELIGLPVRAAA